VPVDEPFANDVFEAIGHFSLADVRRLRTRNGTLHERMRDYRAHARGFSEMLTKFYPKLDFDESELTLDDIKALVDLQVLSEFDVVAIPDCGGSNATKYAELVLQTAQYVLNNRRIPMPYVRIDSDPAAFSRKVKIILDNKGIFQALGIIFRAPYSRYYPNYDYLRRISDEPIWIHQSNLNRVFSSRIPLTTAHLSQMFCIDTVSVESRRVMAPFMLKPLERVRRFDSSTLGQMPMLAGPMDARLSCCPVCSGLTGTDIVSKFRNGEIVDTRTLEHGLRVHEVFASTAEFDAARIAIQRSYFDDYARSKKYLAETLNQESLFGKSQAS